MNRQELIANIKRKKSFLCVGLDTEINKIPKFLLSTDDPVFEFNKAIISATIEYAVAYKPNIAFYESQGIKGWKSLQKTIDFLKPFKKEVFVIADAKRGDIGNTSSQYARTYFDEESSGFDFDAVTVAPYMGEDSVKPFLEFNNKWVILLALTSNKGAENFQFLKCNDENSKYLYQKVLEISKEWGTPENMMYVVGATQAAMLSEIRKIVPEHFLLVPGVGAQGGSLQQVAEHGLNKDCGLLVNASRSILYASSERDFGEKAASEAKKLKDEMEAYLIKYL
ncbi:MAG: orotidine-5'-phosphate decarboxylase [Bacteroidales bacterium]|jgi:orotidine-5'-phosphate decarboxylase|nr:orotidine-5'-phosphate decarboxylase [Bacteroidales bacterium]MDD4213500.1 orotidine-5'-phosphate decarboxylase [Bacteroidales bacterium]